MSSTVTQFSQQVRHSRMLLAGIQAESGLDPRLKHSGVTVLELHLFGPAAIFEGGHEVHEVYNRKCLNPSRPRREIRIPHLFLPPRGAGEDEEGGTSNRTSEAVCG